MKNKNGLGRIPKSLAWIDTDADIVQKEQAPIVAVKAAVEDIKQSPSKGVEEVSIDSHQVKEKNVSSVVSASSCQKGLPEGWTRATFIVEQELNEKIKALAYWERLTVKEVVHDALMQYMQGKNVRSIPKKK